MRTVCAFAFCAVVCQAEGPLLDQPARDFWSSQAVPGFMPLLGEGVVGAHALFPGAGGTSAEHTLVFGKRPGQGDGPWFSDLYAADQVHALRTAGFCLGDVDYASSVSSDSQSVDGRQRAWRETGRGAWSVLAWYEPQRNRVLKGLTVHARDRRHSEYRAADDSLLDIGVERRVTSAEETAGSLGLTAMVAGPRAGLVRIAADFSGWFGRGVDWYRPATSELAESYSGLKTNALRLDISAGYLRVDADRGRSLLVNAGIHGGGMRSFRQTGGGGAWKSWDTADAQVDTLGGYVEVSGCRRVRLGPWEAFCGAAGFWHVAFNYDDAANGSWIEQCRNERRKDAGEACLPLLVRLWIGDRGYAFCSWRPSLSYARIRQDSGPGHATVREEAGVHLAEGAMGVCLAPVERVRLAVAPALANRILLLGAECSILW